MFLHPMKGRGAVSNPAGRFERLSLDVDVDVEIGVEVAPAIASDVATAVTPTTYYRDHSRSVNSRNDSPDIPFEYSLNPYRGCEHGCVYCYARPTHEYFGLSAGLDFETRIFVKEQAAALLRTELARPGWPAEPLIFSGVTDPYQPIERRLGITRTCLEVLATCRQPVGAITKSALILRDIDLLRELARHDAIHVALSITTLDESLRRALEPRAAPGEARLDAVARLNEAGIPAGVMIAPVIPGLNDHEIPAILARAARAGARFAGYTLLRLPHGVKELFSEWLDVHMPARKARVLSRIRDTRGGRLSDPRFGSRMRGEGPVADLTAALFRAARRRAGIPRQAPALSPAGFRRPVDTPSLLDLL
jgi:DNA repair photolyase